MFKKELNRTYMENKRNLQLEGAWSPPHKAILKTNHRETTYKNYASPLALIMCMFEYEDPFIQTRRKEVLTTDINFVQEGVDGIINNMLNRNSGYNFNFEGIPAVLDININENKGDVKYYSPR